MVAYRKFYLWLWYFFVLCKALSLKFRVNLIVSKTKSSQLKSLNYRVELHNVPRSALSHVIKKIITRDKRVYHT